MGNPYTSACKLPFIKEAQVAFLGIAICLQDFSNFLYRRINVQQEFGQVDSISFLISVVLLSECQNEGKDSASAIRTILPVAQRNYFAHFPHSPHPWSNVLFFFRPKRVNKSSRIICSRIIWFKTAHTQEFQYCFSKV